MPEIVAMRKGLTLEVLPDVDAVAQRVADVIVETVWVKPDAVLSLPTGSTPLPVYRELARRVKIGEVDFTKTTVFILDEYVGLDSSDPNSYRETIRREATLPLGIPDARVFGPRGESSDPETAAEAYDQAIQAAGGVDLLVAGVGRNGHIAFNEPGTSFQLGTHVAELTPATRVDNARFFEDESHVPTRAITQGPATILSARKLVLVATGANKAEAIAAALTLPPSENCPASLVQLHTDAIVVVDEEAKIFT